MQTRETYRTVACVTKFYRTLVAVQFSFVTHNASVQVKKRDLPCFQKKLYLKFYDWIQVIENQDLLLI